MYSDERTYWWEQKTGRKRIDPRLHRLSVEALTVSPQESMVWNNKGLSSHQRGRFDEAIKHFNKAILIDPQNAEALNNMGMSYYSLGLIEKEKPYPNLCYFQYALECLDKAVKIDPQNANIWYNKALAEYGGLNSSGQYVVSINL